jgi:hypothetical protein
MSLNFKKLPSFWTIQLVGWIVYFAVIYITFFVNRRTRYVSELVLPQGFSCVGGLFLNFVISASDLSAFWKATFDFQVAFISPNLCRCFRSGLDCTGSHLQLCIKRGLTEITTLPEVRESRSIMR